MEETIRDFSLLLWDDDRLRAGWLHCRQVRGEQFAVNKNCFSQQSQINNLEILWKSEVNINFRKMNDKRWQSNYSAAKEISANSHKHTANL